MVDQARTSAPSKRDLVGSDAMSKGDYADMTARRDSGPVVRELDKLYPHDQQKCMHTAMRGRSCLRKAFARPWPLRA